MRQIDNAPGQRGSSTLARAQGAEDLRTSAPSASSASSAHATSACSASSARATAESCNSTPFGNHALVNNCVALGLDGMDLGYFATECIDFDYFATEYIDFDYFGTVCTRSGRRTCQRANRSTHGLVDTGLVDAPVSVRVSRHTNWSTGRHTDWSTHLSACRWVDTPIGRRTCQRANRPTHHRSTPLPIDFDKHHETCRTVAITSLALKSTPLPIDYVKRLTGPRALRDVQDQRHRRQEHAVAE